MKNFHIQDQLAVYIINSRFMLNALSNYWTKENSKKHTLDEHLWNTLKDHISAHHSVYSIDHIQSLFSDFRNQESNSRANRYSEHGQVLKVGLRYMANTYFKWRHSTPMIRHDKVLQVQHWLAVCNPEPLQCYLWAIDYEPIIAGKFGDSTGPHHRQLSEEAIRMLLHGPLLSAVDDPTVQRLRREGLAEIHRHLNGTILPSLLWSYLIHAPQRLSPRSLAGSLDGLNGRDCIALLRTAGDLRAALIWRLHKQYVTQTWNKAQQGCNLCLKSASDGNSEDEIFRQFKMEFDPKKKECVVLIVRAASHSDKWTLAGFDDAREFRTVVIDDPNHELSKELKKAPINKSRIVKLAISSLGLILSNQYLWNYEVLERLKYPYESLPVRFQDFVTFKISGLPDYRDPAALLPYGEDEPLIGERAFLYHAFRLFHESTNDAVLAAVLHTYLLIQNLIWRALIQPRVTAKGFDRFDRYHGLFLRRHEKDNAFSIMRERYLHRLIQAQRTSGVRWIELRTAPFDGVLWEARRLENALQSIQKKEIADRGIEPERILQGFDDDLLTTLLTTPGQQKYQLNLILEKIRANSLQAGLIFHFIKQADPLKAREQDDIIPCRHSRLRCLVWKQAIEIRRVRRSRRYGQYIVGLDAANSELNARPEVFAPAIRWLREVPCLPADPAYETLIRRFDPNEPNHYGLTFHVGEDFRHLLSGLRAVDEALRFLDMGPGDRIGHGLALGLSYKTWCERVGGEVAMPHGERLDDLVWLRERLSKEPGRFGRLLFVIDDKIRRLAWELYSPLIEALESKNGSLDWARHRDWELLQLALVDWQHQPFKGAPTYLGRFISNLAVA